MGFDDILRKCSKWYQEQLILKHISTHRLTVLTSNPLQCQRVHQRFSSCRSPESLLSTGRAKQQHKHSPCISFRDMLLPLSMRLSFQNRINKLQQYVRDRAELSDWGKLRCCTLLITDLSQPFKDLLFHNGVISLEV